MLFAYPAGGQGRAQGIKQPLQAHLLACQFFFYAAPQLAQE